MAFFFNTLKVFSLFCVAIVISEPFFAGAYLRPDFVAIGRKLSLRLDISGLLYLLVSTRAVIGQFSGPYSPVRPVKI